MVFSSLIFLYGFFSLSLLGYCFCKNQRQQNVVLLIFSLIFFALVLFFSLRPAGITVWIGKIINPLFLIFLSVLVISALINPSAGIAEVAPAAGYESGALFSGFIEGYGTMDAIAGLAFGIVVIDIIRSMGVTNDADNGLIVAKDDVGAQPSILDPLGKASDLFFLSFGFDNNDHRNTFLSLSVSCGTKKMPAAKYFHRRH